MFCVEPIFNDLVGILIIQFQVIFFSEKTFFPTESKHFSPSPSQVFTAGKDCGWSCLHGAVFYLKRRVNVGRK